MKKPSWQDTQKTRNFKKLQNIQNWKKINLKCKKVFYCIFKSVLCKSLIVLIVTLLYCILHVYVELCTNRAFGSVKRYFDPSRYIKVKIRSLPSSIPGLTFLYLPNVLIHEPNEFIHVRKLKTILKIQIHNFLSAKSDFLCADCVTRTRLITGSNLVPSWLELCYSDLV